MAYRCDYCKEEFKWSGKDYHLLRQDGFCSAECSNKSNIASGTNNRFCTNTGCGKEFRSTDTENLLCEDCSNNPTIRCKEQLGI